MNQVILAPGEQMPPERRLVLRGVSWETYEALRDDDANHHVRMSYDSGTLEIMSPSDYHEVVKRLLGQLIETLTTELDIPRRSLSATTWRHRDLAKGLEADECYYIRNHRLVSQRVRVDWAAPPA